MIKEATTTLNLTIIKKPKEEVKAKDEADGAKTSKPSRPVEAPAEVIQPVPEPVVAEPPPPPPIVEVVEGRYCEEPHIHLKVVSYTQLSHITSL